jgi:hypothetical protein
VLSTQNQASSETSGKSRRKVVFEDLGEGCIGIEDKTTMLEEKQPPVQSWSKVKGSPSGGQT